MAKRFKSLRDFLHLLRQERELLDFHEEVDPHLELAEIHRRMIAQGGPALFFHNVKGSPFPVVTNLFGTEKRVKLAFPPNLGELVEKAVNLAKEPPSLKMAWKERALLGRLTKIGLKRRGKAPVKECCIHDLEKLPFTKSWPLDGGSFLTLPLVYTESYHRKGASNLGMYRIQRYNHQETGLHFQIGKGGGYHYEEWERANLPLPVNIFLGGPPAYMLSAIAPLPENLSELLLASFLQGEKMATSHSPYNHYPLLAECEFALVGYSPPHERRLEGPFGDHYGYYSWAHDFPLFKCQAIYHRKDAIFPATVVGKPYQEDYFIGNYLQRLLSPLFPLVMPGVKKLWSYGETGFHSLAAAVVKERFYRECMHTAFRILGEGQLALTKFLLVTDQEVNLEDFEKTLTLILERIEPASDLFIFPHLSLDTLDYTGPELNRGSRGILLGIGEKKRELLTRFEGPSPYPCKVFSPGCLLIQAPAEIEVLLNHYKEWPLLILVDDIHAASKEFLWTVFTRFEPAQDIYAKHDRVVRHKLVYTLPILIDARMKPSYPPVVEVDSETSHRVSVNYPSIHSN